MFMWRLFALFGRYVSEVWVRLHARLLPLYIGDYTNQEDFHVRNYVDSVVTMVPCDNWI